MNRTADSDFQIYTHRSEVRGFGTLVDALECRAGKQKDETAFRFLCDDDGDDENEGGGGRKITVTYGELARSSRNIAALLQQRAGRGERALLIFPPGLEYIAAFFGCLYAGVIAVPVYPPNPSRIDLSLKRLEAVVRSAGPLVALTTSSMLPLIEPIFAGPLSRHRITCLATDPAAAGPEERWKNPGLDSEDLAFLQYTSGSTGEPRGVMVSHANLLSNLPILSRAFRYSENYTGGVSWLPQYHDMGLIGGMLLPLWAGYPVTIMSPLTFLYRPYLWLREMSATRGTASGGPNFAYDHARARITAAEKETLDLSNWEVAVNGAEPVRAETMERFYLAFRECGFRRETFAPCYGLAEATLIVSGGWPKSEPVILSVSDRELENNRVVETGGEAGSKSIVGCGKPIPGHRLVIVNTETLEPCPGDRVGEIWLAGPSVARGYWNSPEATGRSFGATLPGSAEGPFLRTGDLGFMKGGELFVTGRIKDMLIIRGRNHYPQDIERTVEESHPALRKGCGAAFTVEIDGADRLVIAQEVKMSRSGGGPQFDEIIMTIRRAVRLGHDVEAQAVILLASGQVPKTSSGKLQRFACREAYLAGSLDEAARWEKS